MLIMMRLSVHRASLPLLMLFDDATLKIHITNKMHKNVFFSAECRVFHFSVEAATSDGSWKTAVLDVRKSNDNDRPNFDVVLRYDTI